MNKIFYKWDLFHLLATAILLAGNIVFMPLGKLFIGFMALLQLVWLAWLMAGRGLITPLAKTYLAAIRGLMSFAIALLFLDLMGGREGGLLFLCSLLGFSALSLVIVFSVHISQEQAKFPAPGMENRNPFFYANGCDPRVLVPRGSLGVGITLNFAQPEAWLVLLLLIGGPLLVTLFMK